MLKFSVEKFKQIDSTQTTMRYHYLDRKEDGKSIHSSDISIIQKFLTNQITADEIKMCWIPNFSLKLLSDPLH